MELMGTDLAFAAEALRKGNLVGIPTETVYGLAANALDPAAVARIFEAKNRPAFDPLIVHVADMAEAQKYCKHIPELAFRLAEKFSPGPLTYILPKNQLIPDLVSAGHPTIGIRIPNHPLTLALLQQLDFPLAAPSANPFGFVSPTTAQHVLDQLGGEVTYVLDGGPCQVGLESTIIDLGGEQPKVLRLGGLSVEALELAIGQRLAVQTSSSNPKAPGMLLKHYAPGVELCWEDERPQQLPAGTAFLRFQHNNPAFFENRHWLLSPSGDLAEAANRLFAVLREIDKAKPDLVLVERFPETGLGRAINDRLSRAVFSAAKAK